MAVGSFLALRHRDGPAGVLRYNMFGQVNPVGNTFGSAENDTTNSTIAMASNRVVQFKGVNDLYTLQGDDIWRYDGDGTTGGDWVSVHTLQDPASGAEGTYRVGPFITYVNNRPLLACVYYVNTGLDNWRGVTSYDGITWTETADTPLLQPRVTAPTASMWCEHVFRNVIYFNVIINGAPQNTYMIFFNPSTMSLGYINTNGLIASAQNQSTSVAIFKGRQYMLGVQQGLNVTGLWEVQGGSVRLKASFAQNQNFNARSCLFSDGVNLYSFSNDNGTTRWKVSKWTFNSIDSSFTYSDITSSVLPDAAYGTTSVYQGSDRWVALYDRVSNQIILAYSQRGESGGSRWVFYTWNGDSTLIGDDGFPQGSGGSAADALTIDYHRGTGARLWRESDPHAIIEDRTEVANGERIEFRLYSLENSLTVDVDLLYDLNDGSANIQGTLSNPSAGTLNGNVIENLTADPSGSTLYEVTWLNASDGIGRGQPTRKQLRVTRA